MEILAKIFPLIFKAILFSVTSSHYSIHPPNYTKSQSSHNLH
nr:MAG TPA: hypothetical protein [Caudoviricetes sp.]